MSNKWQAIWQHPGAGRIFFALLVPLIQLLFFTVFTAVSQLKLSCSPDSENTISLILLKVTKLLYFLVPFFSPSLNSQAPLHQYLKSNSPILSPNQLCHINPSHPLAVKIPQKLLLTSRKFDRVTMAMKLRVKKFDGLQLLGMACIWTNFNMQLC